MEGAAHRDDAVHARLVAGDDTALAEVYDQYAPVVHGVALRLVGATAARDVTQEVFVALWQHPLSFDPQRGSLRTFLSLAARRRAIDLLRRQGRGERREERAAHQASVPPPDVEEAALAMVVGERLRAAVAALPEGQRRAVELAYFDGLTYRQVAARLGIAEGTAKSRLRLGLAHLAAALGEEQVAWA